MNVIFEFNWNIYVFALSLSLSHSIDDLWVARDCMFSKGFRFLHIVATSSSQRRCSHQTSQKRRLIWTRTAHSWMPSINLFNAQPILIALHMDQVCVCVCDVRACECVRVSLNATWNLRRRRRRNRRLKINKPNRCEAVSISNRCGASFGLVSIFLPLHSYLIRFALCRAFVETLFFFPSGLHSPRFTSI